MKSKINIIQLIYLQHIYKINLLIIIITIILRIYLSANTVFADDELIINQVTKIDKDLNSISSNSTGAVGSRPIREFMGSMAKKAIPQEYKDAIGGNLAVQVKKSIKLDAESIERLSSGVKDKLTEAISAPKQEAISKNPNTVPFGPVENPKRELNISSNGSNVAQILSNKQQSNIPPEFYKKITFGKYTQSTSISLSSNNSNSFNNESIIVSKL